MNIISISKSAEFLLSSSVPDVESHCPSVSMEDEWMDFNSQSCNIFLFKLTSQVTFDKSSLKKWFMKISMSHNNYSCMINFNLTFPTPPSPTKTSLNVGISSCAIFPFFYALNMKKYYQKANK